MENKRKRILILTGDAGLGHRSAAEAVQKAIAVKYGGCCESTIDNPLNHPKVPDLIRKSQSDYDEIVKKLPDIYKMGYKITDSTIPVSLLEAGYVVGLIEVIRDAIQKYQPDCVITTYPLFQAPLHAALVVEKKDIPSITVVTDLTQVHHVWFYKSITLCTVPTKSVHEQALKAGLSPKQVITTGLPVNPRIIKLKAIPKKDVRESLGWNRERTSLLVVGSPRMNALLDNIKLIDHSGYDLQLALVAGGNDELYNNFQETKWHHPVKIYNFVESLPEMMRAADFIVCKAGGLIVTESLASGLPLMLVHALPGQETGNVNFVLDNNAGQMCQEPNEILETLCHWLEHDHILLDKIARNASALIPIDAALSLADLAWDLIKHPPQNI